MKNNIIPIDVNNKFNIITLLHLDHKYLKECIKALKNDKSEKKEKLKYAKHFIDTLKKHTFAEEKSVYNSLEQVPDLKKEILEGQCEHDVANHQIKLIESKLKNIRVLPETLEMQIHVLAEIVEHHLEEEEEKMFPKMKKDLDDNALNALGYQFMKARQFTKLDLKDYPKLQQELSIVNIETKSPNKKYSVDVSKHLKKHAKAS